MPNKSKITEKVTVLSYRRRLALHSRGTTSCPVSQIQPASQLSHAGLCHLVMIYLPRVLSCPGISTRTCNGYVAGRGHVYTAQHRALSEIPIWLGGSQHTYVEQQSSLQKFKPEISSHIQAQKQISSAQNCTACISQPSRIRASKEICVLISAVQGWLSPQRWLCCLFFSSWWQNQLFPQPLLYSRCRNTICSFLPFLLSTGYNQDDLCQNILIILFMS